MTNTLQTLALDPQAFDTKLAELHGQHDAIVARIGAIEENAHREAGDRKTYVGRHQVWQLSLAEALAKVPNLSFDRDTLLGKLAEVQQSMREFDAVYARAPWTRYFPSITKSQPHIHRTLTCRTLHADTMMSWAPELSGKTDADAVAELDEALCSVCFPDAPVALHNYTSRKSQADRDERQAEKDARATAKFAKILSDAEQFRTGGRYGEKVTTVAKCKELIRKAVEEGVVLDWYTSPQADQQLTDWTPDQRAQRERNGRVSLAEARRDAAEARRVLIAREAAHEGWGMTEDAIDTMMARKDKAARKEWGL